LSWKYKYVVSDEKAISGVAREVAPSNKLGTNTLVSLGSSLLGSPYLLHLIFNLSLEYLKSYIDINGSYIFTIGKIDSPLLLLFLLSKECSF
jgi:hypothetical protein